MTDYTECDRLGHDERVTFSDFDDDVTYYVCDRCGAEWWED